LILLRSAAAVFILATSSAFLIYIWRKTNDSAPALLAERTGPNQVKTILLADSTEVVLNANSILEYSPRISFTRDREVRLEGNAFFNVKRDRGYRSFIIHTRKVAVTVLGTTFNIDARSAATEVVLTSGKVKMTAADQPAPVYLLPGDKVSLDTVRHTFVRSAADVSLYSAWMEGQWNFRHKTLEEITGLITKYYGTEVSFRNNRSRRLRIDAVIPVGSLQKLVPVLEQTIHRKMTLSNNVLIID
jgi:ferric-dicitrate binding protein FerR (iron transport regulator)